MASSTRAARRSTRFVLALALGATLSCGPAHAQQSLAKMLEPTRFALVIGNANYGDHGNLPTLGSPCSKEEKEESDAKVVAGALADAKWQVDMKCDLTTDELEIAIKNFNNRVIREPRAFGIIYFSGHGAEIAGTNYLFGIDANIDEKVEYDKFRQNENAVLFGESAVPLDVAMRKVQPLWGKAVAVFVDACRTNTFLDTLRDAGLKYIRHPAKASEPTNVLYAFSTQAGEPSPDGGPGGVSLYARAMDKVIRSQSPDQSEEVDLLVTAVGTKVIVESKLKQFTGRAGQLMRPPKFCIRGCPSLEAEWKSFNDQFGQQTQLPSRVAPIPMYAFASMVGERSASANRVRLAQASAGNGPSPWSQPASPIATGVLPTTREIRFDVLYCVGDSAEEQRRERSLGIRDRLLQFTGVSSPVGGFEVGEVRVVPVPPAVNQVIYKASDSVLTYNADSPAQKQWADKLQTLLEQQLRVEEKPGAASDYMTILVCDGAYAPTEPGPTIYVQAATGEQMAKASGLVADLTKSMPTAKVAKEIEVVKKSPNATEVRYFSSGEAAHAAAVARVTQEKLGRAVRARFVAGYETKLNGARLVEVWVGKDEAP